MLLVQEQIGYKKNKKVEQCRNNGRLSVNADRQFHSDSIRSGIRQNIRSVRAKERG